MTTEFYDSIGVDYAKRRKPDPRIEAPILDALGDSRTVLNVGAGTGSYEPRDRRVVAVEPSRVMIEQRRRDAAPVVRASATSLPFRDDCFETTLAVLTIHHWPDPGRGLRELRRVAREAVVVFTYDIHVGGFWLSDYFPEILEIDRALMPEISALEDALGPIEVTEVPIPHDCTDAFLGAHWRRPEAYLDAGVRSASSVFARMKAVEAGASRLAADLESGDWHRRYGGVLELDAIDLGYRLVVARREA